LGKVTFIYLISFNRSNKLTRYWNEFGEFWKIQSVSEIDLHAFEICMTTNSLSMTNYMLYSDIVDENGIFLKTAAIISDLYV